MLTNPTKALPLLNGTLVATSVNILAKFGTVNILDTHLEMCLEQFSPLILWRFWLLQLNETLSKYNSNDN